MGSAEGTNDAEIAVDLVVRNAISSQTPWERLWGALNLEEPYEDDPRHIVELPVGDSTEVPVRYGVHVSRTADSSGGARWIKRIDNDHPQLAGLVEWETSANNTLFDHTGGVGNSLVRHVVRVVKVAREIRPSHGGAGIAGTTLLESGSIAHQNEVVTLHAGVTLDRLLNVGACWSAEESDGLGRPIPTAIAPGRNIVRVVGKIIRALEAVDDVGIQHCDIAFRNIAVKCNAQFEDDPVLGERLSVSVDWDSARLIDFGLCCRKNIAPPIVLPRNPNDPAISQRLRDITRRLALLNEERRKNGEPLLTSSSPEMREYRELDWREDLYQLGYCLSSHFQSYGLFAGAEAGRPDAIRELFLGNAPGNGLLDNLLVYGGRTAKGGLRSNTLRPHKLFVEKIEDCLSRLTSHLDGCDRFYVFRAHTDAGYRELLAGRRAKLRAAQVQQALEADRERREILAERRSIHDLRAGLLVKQAELEKFKLDVIAQLKSKKEEQDKEVLLRLQGIAAERQEALRQLEVQRGELRRKDEELKSAYEDAGLFQAGLSKLEDDLNKASAELDAREAVCRLDEVRVNNAFARLDKRLESAFYRSRSNSESFSALVAVQYAAVAAICAGLVVAVIRVLGR